MHRRSLALLALSSVLLPVAAIHCGSAPQAAAPAARPSVSAAPPSATPAVSSAAAYPATPKRPVFDAYFGTKVEDDYRWLEDWSNPEVQAWSAAENTYARHFLDGLAIRPTVRARVEGILSHDAPDYLAVAQKGGLLFALKQQPPKQQPLLVAIDAKTADVKTEKVLVDPNVLDASGKTTLDWYVPSHDGKKVAVSLSEGGTESGTVHVYDVATAKETGDVVPRVNGGTAGGSLAWNADGTGFYFTRYPHAGERPAEDVDFFQQIYFHKLGTPESADAYSLGKDFPRIAEVKLQSSPDNHYVLASVENGDSDQWWHWALGPRGWTKLADITDNVASVELGRGASAYMVVRKGAPRGKVVRVALDVPGAPVEIVPQSDAVIQGIEVTDDYLFVAEIVGGPSQLRYVPLAPGKKAGTVATEAVSQVGRVVSLGGDAVLFRSESYVTPPAWYRVTPGAAPEKTSLAQAATVDFGDVEAVRETCTSKDGTTVPVSILRKKGAALDGTLPVLLTGYGGFGITRAPRYRPQVHVWLEQGGAWAEANLRGGGEMGEEWHHAGNLVNKQNVFDDFYACARRVVDLGYTKPERLAVEGGSNGGLLMGAFFTQHPDAAKAVVSHVGYYDMLRFETASNGVFNTTEYGSVKDPAQFQALYAYSPYQHVTDGTAYPAILFMTGANDPRVNPFHSRKMTARLQAATSSGQPVLLRTSGDTGHGMGTPLAARIEEYADGYSFLFDRLGVTYKTVP